MPRAQSLLFFPPVLPAFTSWLRNQKNLEPCHQNHNSLDLEGILKTTCSSPTNFINGKKAQSNEVVCSRLYNKFKTETLENLDSPSSFISGTKHIQLQYFFCRVDRESYGLTSGPGILVFRLKRALWKWLFLCHFNESSRSEENKCLQASCHNQTATANCLQWTFFILLIFTLRAGEQTLPCYTQTFHGRQISNISIKALCKNSVCL